MRIQKKRWHTFFLIAALITLCSLRGFAADSTVKGAVTDVSQIPKAASGKLNKNGKYYQYTYKNGQKAVGWKKIKSKYYYFSTKGNAYTGLKKLGKYYYYFTAKGVRKTGWVKIDGKKHYFRPSKNGIAAKGRLKIGKSWYYFNKKGKRITGWVKRSGEYYYFKSNGKQAFGWQTIDGQQYYLDKKQDGVRVSGEQEIDGITYHFSDDGRLLSADGPDFPSEDTNPSGDSFFVDSTGNRLKRSTLKKLLQTAMKPVGQTMYVWGGGWTFTGGGAGASTAARSIGVNPGWSAYFNQQDASYNYKNKPSYNDNGLDCSGFVGWVIYNTFNTTSGNAGYVMGAEYQAKTFAEYGWGSYTPYYEVSNHRAGDIMSLSAGHVYIVIGSCSDGSIVLVHSSPNGVMISGTTTRDGNRDSQAIALSDKYMRRYYPAAYPKFAVSDEKDGRHIWRDEEYLTKYSRMRWYLNGSQSMLSDPDGYANMTAAQILKDLFGE